MARQTTHVRPTPPIHCELLAHSDSPHLQQLYTGMRDLYQKRVIRLKQRLCAPPPLDPDRLPHLKDSQDAYARVRLNGRLLLFYDVHDSFEIDMAALRECDFYFKRSFLPSLVARLAESSKILPLGLNYSIRGSGIDWFAVQRAKLSRGPVALKQLFRAMHLDSIFGGKMHTPRASLLEAYPAFHLPPRVLFMARTWDPADARSFDKADEREVLNASRAECIRTLRRELKGRFLGGFAHHPYARAYFGDCLLPDPKISRPKRYLEVLRDFPITVTTVGLHGSNGWKLGEYVSTAKAILSEPLHYEVPGGFARGRNYLEFSSPTECVESATRLIENRDLRCAMMMENFRYHRSFVRPDVLVLNTLAVALGD